MHNDGEYLIPFKMRLLDDPTPTKIIEYSSLRSPAPGIIVGQNKKHEQEQIRVKSTSKKKKHKLQNFLWMDFHIFLSEILKQLMFL